MVLIGIIGSTAVTEAVTAVEREAVTTGPVTAH